MIEGVLRPLYQKVCVDPVLALPVVRRLSPAQLTALGLACGLLTLPLLLLHFNGWAVTALLFSGYCDTLDGSLARRRHMHSPVGAVWDITADRLVECTVILGLFGCDPISRAWLTALMLSSVLLCVTSFLVVGIFSRNTSEKSFHYSPGLIERAEALICWSITILWPSTYFFLSYLFTSLVCLTAVIRLWQFSRIQGGSGKRAP